MSSAARFAYQLLIALWLGGGVFFAAAVAPTLFKVLTPPQAAAVVGRLLPILERSALVLPIVLIAAAWLVEGAPVGAGRTRTVLLGATLVLAAVAVFWITPSIQALREQAGGDVSRLERTDPIRQSFGRLHGISTLILLAELLLAAVALALAPRPR